MGPLPRTVANLSRHCLPTCHRACWVLCRYQHITGHRPRKWPGLRSDLSIMILSPGWIETSMVSKGQDRATYRKQPLAAFSCSEKMNLVGQKKESRSYVAMEEDSCGCRGWGGGEEGDSLCYGTVCIWGWQNNRRCQPSLPTFFEEGLNVSTFLGESLTPPPVPPLTVECCSPFTQALRI